MNRPCNPGIAFLYEAGVTMQRIKSMTGHADCTIYRAVDEAGLRSRNKREKAAPFNLDALRRRYEAGASTVDLAEQYECDQRTIAKYLRQAGAQMRARGRPPSGRAHNLGGWNGEAVLNEDAIIADYQSGLLAKVICRTHGICYPTLRRILRQNNVPHRGFANNRRLPANGLPTLSEARTA